MRKRSHIILLLSAFSLAPIAGAAQFYNAPPFGYNQPFPTPPMADQYQMAPPFAQPGPYWMLTPPAALPPFGQVGTLQNTAVQSPAEPLQATNGNTPRRWAPRTGDLPPRFQTPAPGNPWAQSNAQWQGQRSMPPSAPTPPKWPTP